ncbi:MAG: alpha-amylase family glycosyl hydrolase [Nanobdellota archaeon]
MQYQWEKFINKKKADKDIDGWTSDFGPKVISRKDKKTKVRFNVLIDNPNLKVFLVGNFNEWGKKNLKEYELSHDKHSIFASIDKEIEHKEPYKFLVFDGEKKFFIQDPAAPYFDDNGNSVFWDFEKGYKKRYGFINNLHRSVKVLQTDLPGLIAHWADKDGVCGRDVKEKDYFSFVADSGILDHVKKLGFNTIQFLPFAQSIDGDNWKYRYLVPFQFAIQKNWGNPDEFMRMIDECHKRGIAVIGDFVIGHLPYKDFRVFGQSSEHNGLHHWKARHGYELFMKEPTAWGTMRFDFDNKYVRQFIVSSCLHFLKHYRIDGLRIDNVDGIIRYGDNGQGEERPNGRKFLRELNSTIYTYNPWAMIHFESHYFYKDNAKMLVVPFEEDERALGATAYNSSRMTYYFHVYYMLMSAEKITPWKFRDIAEEKEWGQSNSTIADFHNHDAAAGLMEQRATGSYAYDTMTHTNPANHYHALGKIKVMEAIISFCTEGRTLDLAQTFLMQTGTFEHDSSIRWYLTFTQCNRNLLKYKEKVNKIMDDPAFWPMFTKNRKFLNVDDSNKMLVVERSADYKGKKTKYVIAINLSSWVHHNYKVGVTDKADYRVVFNGDLFDYSGSGLTTYPEKLKNKESDNFGLLEREVELGKVGPYSVVVLKSENSD